MLVTLDSMNGDNINSILQVKNILQYFVDMKHIEVQHVKLNNIQKQKDNYSCGVLVCLYSYYASFMINKYLSKEKWCKTFYYCSTTYDIHIFRSVIHDFCFRLQYDKI